MIPGLDRHEMLHPSFGLLMNLFGTTTFSPRFARSSAVVAVVVSVVTHTPRGS